MTADKSDVKPWQGTAQVRRLAATMIAAVVVACAAAPLAQADESTWPTAQAVAANATWVPYLDPPPKPAAICMVDSGVEVTPDTPPDSPEGPIVKRLALDGGPGTAADQSWEGLHGTRMAFVAGAPMNNWGTVGLWPGVRIVSIRAMPMGQTAFPFEAYTQAIALCRKWAASTSLVVVNLSLSCGCAPAADDAARLQNQITIAHAQDLSVVASAGNGGGPIGSPASEPGVMSVGAGGQDGRLCSFSSRGPGLSLIAPGCDLDLANPTTGEQWSSYEGGTSAASMATAAGLALVRSYRPDLTMEAAEQLVRSSSRAGLDGRVIDLEGLLRSAGLGALVDSAQARASDLGAPSRPIRTSEPRPGDETAVPVVGHEGAGRAAGPAMKQQLPSPKIDRLVRREDRLIISVRAFPAQNRLEVALARRTSEFGYDTIARAQRNTRTVALRTPKRWGRLRVSARLIALGDPTKTSRAVLRYIRR